MTRNRVIHVIDDDEAALESLAFLLTTDGFAVETYESAVAFVEASPITDGGCIVTDVRMPEMDGIALLRHLRARNNDCRVVVVTGHADIPLAIEAMTSGAFDFIEKPFDADLLLGTVRAALDPQHSVLSTEFTKEDVEGRLATLSGRERQVFEGIVRGRSNKAVAEELGLAERTVEIHRANVMTKMQATNLSNLVRIALSLG